MPKGLSIPGPVQIEQQTYDYLGRGEKLNPLGAGLVVNTDQTLNRFVLVRVGNVLFTRQDPLADDGWASSLG